MRTCNYENEIAPFNESNPIKHNTSVHVKCMQQNDKQRYREEKRERKTNLQQLNSLIYRPENDFINCDKFYYFQWMMHETKRFISFHFMRINACYQVNEIYSNKSKNEMNERT